jgi:hypothetical protein
MVALGLTAAAAAVYHGVFQLGFVYDDLSYVVNNRQLREGVSPEGLRWAMTATSEANWHPLTWISHMLDVQLFGLAPAGHHSMNLLFHLIATALLFHALRTYWTNVAQRHRGGDPPSPHVETVAWVAERWTLCGLLMLRCWHRRYCARPEWALRGRLRSIPPHGQTDGGHAAVRAAAPRLLAAGATAGETAPAPRPTPRG